MNAYVAFYNRATCTVYATNAYAAQQLAARSLCVPPKQQYKIAVQLAANPHGPVLHCAASL